MEITIGILSALILVAGFIIWNLLRKTEKAEDIIVYQQTYISKAIEVINFCDNELKKIDAKGTFKSDDEIGFFFTKIRGLQDLLNQFTKKI